jgi:pimeloyl-ACP methyl ester carboxylesterase
MRPSRALTSILLLGGGVAAKRIADHRIATWEANPDACDGDPLRLPEGRPVEVRSHDGATLRGLDCGEGPAVLLVHCWTGHTGFWAPVARRLVDAGFRVVTVDQRGHAASDRGSAPYRPETLGGDVRAWVEGLDLDDLVIAGHSMGGLATMAFVTDHADVAEARVRGLVLVATLASPPKDPRLPEVEFDQSRFLPTVERLMRIRHYGLFTLLRVFGTRPARSQMEATRAGFIGTDSVVRTEAARMMQDFDLRPALPSITLPTQVVAGTHDQLTFLHVNEEVAELIPGARLEVLHGYGHMLPFEAPDQITDCIVQAAKPADAA